MTLKKWAYVAEIGNAIAVVLSLLYVAYELNQNTNAVRASNWQALLDYANAADLVVLQDAASLLVKAESNYVGLTEEEKRRFGMYAQNVFNFWVAAYIYHRQGLLEAKVWETNDIANMSFLEIAGYRDYWERSRHKYLPEFAAHIDGLIEQGG